jgi:hypothetical protein
MLPGTPTSSRQHEEADMIRISDSKEHRQIHDLSAVFESEVPMSRVRPKHRTRQLIEQLPADQPIASSGSTVTG